MKIINMKTCCLSIHLVDAITTFVHSQNLVLQNLECQILVLQNFANLERAILKWFRYVKIYVQNYDFMFKTG